MTKSARDKLTRHWSLADPDDLDEQIGKALATYWEARAGKAPGVDFREAHDLLWGLMLARDRTRAGQFYGHPRLPLVAALDPAGELVVRRIERLRVSNTPRIA